MQSSYMCPFTIHDETNLLVGLEDHFRGFHLVEILIPANMVSLDLCYQQV
jgi:hypothetical protein